MKPSFRSATFASAILVLASSLAPAQAQSWQTVDDFISPAGFTVEGACYIACGSDGRLLTAISVIESTAGQSVTHTWFRRSADHGGSWVTAGKLTGSGRPQGLAVGPSGAAFAIRHVSPYWEVRRSPDVGDSWLLVDNFLQDTIASPGAIGVAPLGDLFVVGQTLGPQNSRRWLVRRSPDQGQTWVTVDDFTGIWASAVAVNSSVIIVSGRGGNMESTDKPWTTRRSTDGGNTWTTVDEFQLGANLPGWPKAAAGDQRGYFYVVGNAEAVSGSFVTRWIVRRSMDGGQTWQTVDTLTNGSGSASAEAVAVDASGRVFVAGATSAGWLVRVSSDGGSTWANSEQFTYPSGRGQYIRSLATDSSGNVFALGTATDAVGAGHWVIRKMAGPPRFAAGREGEMLRLSWPTNTTGFVLQSATTLTNGGNWRNTSLTPTITNGQKVVTVNPTAPAAFFRLRKP